MTQTYNIQVRVDPAGAQAGARQVESALGRMEQRARQTELLLRRVFSVVAILGAAKAIIETADAYTNLQNRLRVVTSSAAELAAVQQDLFDISQRTRTSFADNVEVYSRFALATRDLGVSQREVLDFTETLNKAIILSGAAAQEARAGIFQLSQAMSKGRLDGDELRSVLEIIPVVADVIAKSLGVTRGELRKLGEQGKLSTDVLLAGFKGAREEMDERFSKTVPTVGQALEQVGNSVLRLVGLLDQATGASGTLASALRGISGALDSVGAPNDIGRSISLAEGKIERLRVRASTGRGDPFGATGPEIARLEGMIERWKAEGYASQYTMAPPYSTGSRGNLPMSAEQEKRVELLRRTNEEIDRENELLHVNAEEREVLSKLLEVEEKFERLKQPLNAAELDALEQRLVLTQRLRQLTETAAEGFKTVFKGMEDVLVSFATTGKFEFKRFADGVVSDLLRIALQAYLTRPLMNLATGFTNSMIGGAMMSDGGWQTTTTPALPGFASGGSFRVGGSGGTDSQLVAFRASPDETVSVTTPGQSNGGGGTQVNVHNYSGAEVREERRREGGKNVVDIMIGAMKRGLSDGTFDNELGSRFGASPSAKRR